MSKNYNLTSQEIRNTFEQLGQVSGSIEGGVSGYAIVDGTGSKVNVIHATASFATTASYALNGESTDTGSLLVTSSAAGSTITFTKGDGTTYQNTITTATAQTASLAERNILTASADFSEITFTKGDGSTFPLDVTPRKVIETVKNKSGVTLAKGTPVYVSGSTGNASNIYAASASLSSRMPAAYVLGEQLTADAEGQGIALGFINGVDTSAFSAGDNLYVGASGGYTNQKPTGSNLIQKLGNVIKVDATNGSGVITGAGRSNDLPNITTDYVWKGDSDGVPQAVAASSLTVATASYVNPLNQDVTVNGIISASGNISGSRIHAVNGFETDAASALGFISTKAQSAFGNITVEQSTSPFVGLTIGSAAVPTRAPGITMYTSHSFYPAGFNYAGVTINDGDNGTTFFGNKVNAGGSGAVAPANEAAFAIQAGTTADSTTGDNTSFAINNDNGLPTFTKTTRFLRPISASDNVDIDGSLTVSGSNAKFFEFGDMVPGDIGASNYGIFLTASGTSLFKGDWDLDGALAFGGFGTTFSTDTFTVNSNNPANFTTGLKVTGSVDVSGSINGDIVSTGTSTFNDITVNGTGSFNYIQSITGSAKIIGDAFLILNNDLPAERYAGIKVLDTGSTDTTASFIWDGQEKDWFYQYSGSDGTDYAIAMFGPEYSTQGSPTYLSNNTIPKGDGGHHLNDSNITDDGSLVTVNSNISASGDISGSRFNATNGFQTDAASALGFISTKAQSAFGNITVDQSVSPFVGVTIGSAAVPTRAPGFTMYTSHSFYPTAFNYAGITINDGDNGTTFFGNKVDAGGSGAVAPAGQASFAIQAGTTADSTTGDNTSFAINNDNGLPTFTKTTKFLRPISASQGIIVDQITGSAGIDIDVSGSTVIIDTANTFGDAIIATGSITSTAAVTGQNIQTTTGNAFIGGGSGFFGDSVSGTAAGGITMYGDYSGTTPRFNALSFTDQSGTYPGPPVSFFGAFSGPIAGNTSGDPFALMAGGAVAGENANWGIMMDQSGDIKTLKKMSIRQSADVSGSLAVTGSQSVIGDVDITGNLEVNGSLTITGSVEGNVTALSIASLTASIDASVGDYYTLTLVSGSNTHIDSSNINPGKTFILKTKQPNPGSGTISFDSEFKFAGGTAPTATDGADKEDIYTFVAFDSTNVYSTQVADLT